MRRSLAVLFGVTLAAARAAANSAAPVEAPPAEAGAPVTAVKTPLQVAHEDLAITCKKAVDEAIGCRFEARYRVVNPTAETQTVAGAFVGYGLADVRTSVDGAAIDRRLTKAEAEGFRRDSMCGPRDAGKWGIGR